ncbi:MAG: hypothetical protein DRI56_11240 [Chloroflexota bacterium]|nr:MAG: hypothetical protein DRI56_11240 [Chloroflexota bacterium]
MFFIAILFLIIIMLVLNSLINKKGGSTIFSRQTKTLIGSEREAFIKQWQEIKKLVKIPGQSNSNQAVIKADQLLDSVLARLGYRGNTGDKLKAARKRFSNYQKYKTAWSAHKMRNAVVHEPGFDLIKETAKSTLDEFEEVLKDLGAI